MATRAEMRAEELVYEIAEELGLTEAEVLRLDAVAVADTALRRLRIELKKQTGRQLTARDYGLSDSRSADVVDLAAYLARPVKA